MPLPSNFLGRSLTMKFVMLERLFIHLLNFVTCEAKRLPCLDIQRFMWMREEVPRWSIHLFESANQEGKKEGGWWEGARDTLIFRPGPVHVWWVTASQLASLSWSLSSKCTVPGKTNANVVTASYSESLDKWKEGLKLAWRISGGSYQCYSVNKWLLSYT